MISSKKSETFRDHAIEATDIEARAKLILALVMSSVMVFMVTLLVTFLNLGFPSDFLVQWVKA